MVGSGHPGNVTRQTCRACRTARPRAGPCRSSLMTHGAIPVEATRTIASSMLPDAFYRLFADLGWRWQAHRHGLAQRNCMRVR